MSSSVVVSSAVRRKISSSDYTPKVSSTWGVLEARCARPAMSMSNLNHLLLAAPPNVETQKTHLRPLHKTFFDLGADPHSEVIQRQYVHVCLDVERVIQSEPEIFARDVF